MNADVFISHSTADKIVAEKICEVLEKRGIACWIAPRDVPIGVSWPASIVHAIEQAKAFLLVLTADANASPYVVTEVNFAFSYRKTIIVFRAADIMPGDDLQFFLACPQWMDGFLPPLEDRVAQMAAVLRLLLRKDQLKPTPGEAPPSTGNSPQLREPPRNQPTLVPRPTNESVSPPTRLPDKTVRPPRVPAPTTAVTGPRMESCVFDEKGRIQSSAFAFAIDGILLRAARRRNDQQRARASVADFLAGLLRAGGLTRLVLQRTGLDPDELYARLREVPEKSAALDPVLAPLPIALNDGTVPEAAQLQAMLARWILHQRDDFTTELAGLLERVAATVRGPVTEQAVLEAMIDTPEWTSARIALPPPAEMRMALAACVHLQGIDANGAVPLDFLAPAARKIVQRAHLLSQQCQCAGISHRLFLAAFVASEEGFAARVCQRAGVDTELLQSLLVTMSSESEHTNGDATSNVILSTEVCARIVSPVLAQARRDAADPQSVTESELFRAFCRVADPAFGQFLKLRSSTAELELIEADLFELMTIDPDRSDRLDQLTLRAREVVRGAHRLALERGVRVIPNRLMLAAFLEQEDSHARGLLEARNILPQKLHDLLVASTEAGAAPKYDLDDEACAKIVTPVIARARTLAKRSGFITESILFRAFCEISDPGFRAALAQMGVDLTALNAGRPNLSSTGAWGPN